MKSSINAIGTTDLNIALEVIFSSSTVNLFESSSHNSTNKQTNNISSRRCSPIQALNLPIVVKIISRTETHPESFPPIHEKDESETETSTKMTITQLIVIRFKFWVARNSRTIKAHLLIASDLVDKTKNRAKYKKRDVHKTQNFHGHASFITRRIFHLSLRRLTQLCPSHHTVKRIPLIIAVISC